MDLDEERERILSSTGSPEKKALMFIQRRHELRLDRRQWQAFVWLLPDDILDAIGLVKQQQEHSAACLNLLPEDFQMLQEKLAAHIAAHPLFRQAAMRQHPLAGATIQPKRATSHQYAGQGTYPAEGVRQRLLGGPKSIPNVT
ncbi:hypothetical protein ABBQ38_001204 [Trebouxia sp. C0009 RCD-2024]